MTAVNLLESIKTFTIESTKDLIMPVKPSEEVEEPEPRAVGVYIGHLPEFSSVKRKAPCILHQIVTRKDIQHPGEPFPDTAAVVRSAFCVYNEDEEEGGLMLLGLMERLRIALLKKVVLNKQFKLDLQAGLESLVYDSTGSKPTHPYYLGEMVSVWRFFHTIEREVNYGKKGYRNIRESGPGPGCDRLGPGAAHGQYGIGLGTGGSEE